MAYRWCWPLLWLSFAHTAWAATFKIGSLGGVMTQPTSNYYHAVYGASLEVARDDGRITGRVGYLERPQFSSAGFTDQEFFGYVQMGTKLTRSKTHGLWAFMGAGQTTGYVRAEPSDIWNGERPPTRHHRVPGLTLATEYSYRMFGIEGAVAHQILVGHTSERQLRGYVAWPYHFFLLRVGVAL